MKKIPTITRFFLLSTVFVPVFVGVSCSSSKSSEVTIVSQGVRGVAESHANARPQPLNTRDALEFIDKNCFECHGPGKPLAAAFSIPAKDILHKDVSWLEGAALNQTVYQTVVNKHLKKVDSPSAMPPSSKTPNKKKTPKLHCVVSGYFSWSCSGG